MAVLTVQQVTLAGTTPSFVSAAAGGDKVPVGDRTFLYVKNAGGSPLTVTLDSKTPSNYGDDANVVVTVAATTGEKMIGPLNPQRFAGTDGNADFSYSGVTSVTVMAVRV